MCWRPLGHCVAKGGTRISNIVVKPSSPTDTLDLGYDAPLGRLVRSATHFLGKVEQARDAILYEFVETYDVSTLVRPAWATGMTPLFFKALHAPSDFCAELDLLLPARLRKWN